MWRKIAVVTAIVCLCLGYKASAQTVTNVQNTSLNGTAGVKLNAAACNGAAGTRWTGWIQVNTQGRVTLDVDFVDANADETSLDIRCETSRSSGTAADAGRDIPVITATASTGINNMTISTWRWLATTGLAPGSSSFTLTLQNIPAPFIECLFTCQGAAAAADTITVFARGINP